ncbi:MAG: restriction endonuclease subunit M [Microcystis aeruginosa Ma_MB_F_20061100_S19]|uniref:Putative type I restriction enzymeP M protein n=1 Tax=Microcystis aeruginosa SPC777 TaxID=482300 RepID=S3KGY7_MICAE|nr:N-6 DNA methylase [Microcystis aeruginosa]NCS00239.1 N-6 DNA methylase [Microcystis aeruginosa L311-01]OCY15193.1 MAG: type I restriction endonuclease subunit M [Microcystis aeruginosa CACIAM 03]TRU15549.1 MAG: restriction endonuclease subunit M [Microcystis aeruginosa Ma_MB_F_20061100_S19D]TRU18336.1 MAG: restriction endonuclease subunit M [Microcystis aeruginosa Ma_MB_F_20061100_S19]EPF23944.1 putative type I restriction enzymeP M protein [Microcystis aeruginosa SPC777]
MPTETPKTYLEQAIADGQAEIKGEGKKERIHYLAADHSERWSDPEEKVRAEFWAELIYKYDYDPKLIKFEVKVPRRTPNDLADIVIYKDEEHKDPYFVFEIKRSDITDAEFSQSIEQACGNRASLAAPFCGSIAGLTRRLLRFDDKQKYPPMERDRNHLTDIPKRFGKPPEWRFYKNKEGQDLKAVPREELRSAIRKCHQTLWEGGRRSPIAAFGEFCKLIFVKYRDEKNPDIEDGQPYAFQRRDGESSEDLSKRILRLYTNEQEKEPGVFTDKINIDPPVIAQVVEHLEALSLDRTELDTKGVAFEEFMGGFFKGDFGQYFTPRELIAFSIELLNPERKHLVLDPACGSGGFLLYALDHVRRAANLRYKNYKSDPRQSIDHFNYWHSFAQNNLFGIEINEELARVAKMNMIIHDDGHTNIVGHDALDFLERLTALKPELVPNKFDVILTNPPFGSVVKSTEKDKGYLDQFDLRHYLSKGTTDTEPDESTQGERNAKRGAKAVKERTSIKTEILFIERVYSYLKPKEGRAAIILPDGILTNSSLQGVRDWMLSHFQILAVVSLPQFAFAYYDAGVKASIVFLRKLGDGEVVSDDQPIFMALAENIGYDATGRKTFNVTVERETPEKEKIERHSCDLFDYRVHFEWNQSNPKEAGWSERYREIIPDTGLIAQWREFQRDPSSFFV